MKKLYCEACFNGCLLTIMSSGAGIMVDGNSCLKGHDFAEDWMKDSAVTVTTTVRTKFPDIPVISVRSEDPIERKAVTDVMHEINSKVVEQELGCGDTLIEDVAGTGVKIIVTSPALMQLGAELENKNEKIMSTGSGSGPSAAAGGRGVVRNQQDGTVKLKVLDDLGADSASGFVGAAGEAVGVEASDEDDSTENTTDDKKSKESYSKKGRAQINRK